MNRCIVPALAGLKIWDICTMLVLVPTHVWERVIPGGGVHCHWKEPSLATVQERLAADTHCTHTALLYTTSVVTYHHASLNSFTVFQIMIKQSCNTGPQDLITYLYHFFVTKISAVMTTHIAAVYSIFIWIPIISDLPICVKKSTAIMPLLF